MRIQIFKPALLLILAASLLSCGDEDNSEPPAELTDFDAKIALDEVWSVSPNAGSGQQFVYLEPLLLDKELVTAGRDGVLTLIALDEGDVNREYELDYGIGAGVGGDRSSWIFSDQNGHVIAIDAANGEQKWRSDVNSEVLTRPLLHAGNVYVRTVDGGLTSLNANTGKVNWKHNKVLPALTLRGNAAPVMTRDWVIVPQDDGRIVALDHVTGKTAWDVEVSSSRGSSEIERLIDIDGRAELYGQVLYVGGYQGALSAIDIQQGKVLWSRDFSTWSGVTVDGDALFVTDERSHVWAIDRFSGATLWKQSSFTARAVTRPVVYRNILVMGDYEGILHILSRADGSIIGREQVGDEDSGMFLPPLVLDNRIITVLRDGEITAFSARAIQPDE